MKRRLLAFALAMGLVGGFPHAALAAPQYSAWGTPVNLGCGGINSGLKDLGPGTSKDGLSLYFASDRLVAGDQDIYVAERASLDAPWGAPVLVPNVNSHPTSENAVSLSRDGHWLFFNSNRSGGLGDIDIWAAYRTHIHDDFDWQTPINLGSGVNTPGFDAGPGYFENDGGTPQLFFGHGASASTQGSTTDIWVADLQADGTFGNARPVPELNSALGDQRPSVRFDGLEIFFFSNRPHGDLSLTDNDIWVATRASVDLPWDAPTDLGSPVNTTAGEFNPHISANGLELFFASTTTGGACGDFDLWVTSRTKRLI